MFKDILEYFDDKVTMATTKKTTAKKTATTKKTTTKKTATKSPVEIITPVSYTHLRE